MQLPPDFPKKVNPKGSWSRYRLECAGCETTTTAHRANGLCVNCYARLRRFIRKSNRAKSQSSTPTPSF